VTAVRSAPCDPPRPGSSNSPAPATASPTYWPHRQRLNLPTRPVARAACCCRSWSTAGRCSCRWMPTPWRLAGLALTLLNKSALRQPYRPMMKTRPALFSPYMASGGRTAGDPILVGFVRRTGLGEQWRGADAHAGRDQRRSLAHSTGRATPSRSKPTSRETGRRPSDHDRNWSCQTGWACGQPNVGGMTRPRSLALLQRER
jgi:hypothetical protein